MSETKSKSNNRKNTRKYAEYKIVEVFYNKYNLSERETVVKDYKKAIAKYHEIKDSVIDEYDNHVAIKFFGTIGYVDTLM